LREFVGLLNSLAIDYVIVGGHAVAFHGHPRYTGDIDFLVRPTLHNARRLLQALHAFGFAETGLTPEDFIKPENIVQIGHPPNRIDLLTSISGVSFDEVWSTRIKAELDGTPVSFPAWETLLKNKQATGRDKDLADVNKLKAIAAKRKPSE
jgi:hypothetical protein